MRLIGIHGKARAGKDTVAEFLREHAFVRNAFADPIRYAVAEMFELTLAQILGHQKEEVIDWLGRSPRYLMQTLGTEWGRNLVHRDVWLLIAKQAWKTIPPTYKGMVIPDVRFENEAAWIREEGELWIIERPGVAAVESHISEAGITPKPGDKLIINDGSFEDLEAQVIHHLEGGSNNEEKEVGKN